MISHPMDVYQHSAFVNRTQSFYQDQRRRARSAGQELDYRLDDLRTFVRNNLGDRHCRYCRGAITPDRFAVMQRIPVERGGSFYFHNLIVVCTSCGAAKGSLDYVEFQELSEL